MLENLVCKKKKAVSIQDIDTQYFNSIEKIGKELWNKATNPKDVFLQYDYLHLLEKFPPRNTSFAYIVFFSFGKPVGVSYYQVNHFDPSKSIQNLSRVGRFFASQLKTNALAVGNGLLTGEHGFYLQNCIEENCHENIFLHAIDVVEQNLIKEGRKTTIQLVKDFFTSQQFLEEKSYHPAVFAPNMILHLRPEWNNFDDYTKTMTTKYRTNVKRADKKRVGLGFLELDAEAIENQKDAIYQLYLKVADSAAFNYIYLHQEYFLEMKKTFGEDYKIVGCYDQNRLIGFYSTLLNYDELETGFIGFEDQYNASHMMYLNFLYDMVKLGIEARAKKIVFSRTAMEIKSSIGAEPYYMVNYLKYHNSILNMALPSIIKLIAPKQTWKQRHPFKIID